MMLAQSMERVARARRRSAGARANWRSPLIEAALAPAPQPVQANSGEDVEQALALVIGTESMVVCKDVLQLDDAQASKVRRWAIRALVAAAKKADLGSTLARRAGSAHL